MIITKVYTFVPDLTADASEVNRNFDDLFSVINGGINSANLASNLTLKASQITIEDTASQFTVDFVEEALNELKGDIGAIAGSTIQDFSEGLIGNVGSASQQFAGHIWSLDEPNLTATQVVAMFLFQSGALFTDTVGTYDLIAGPANPTCAAGINGADYAIYFSGGTNNYLYNDTLLDVMPSAVVAHMWLSPDNGHPTANCCIMSKFNNTAIATVDIFEVILGTAGNIMYYNMANGTGGVILNSNYTFSNGSCSYAHVLITHDSANGARMFVNGELDCYNVSAKTLCRDGVACPFFLGIEVASAGTVDYPYKGNVAGLRIENRYITQKDVDISFATKYDRPTATTGDDVDVRAQIYPDGISECRRIIDWEELEVARNSASIYRLGGTKTGLSTADRLKIFLRS